MGLLDDLKGAYVAALREVHQHDGARLLAETEVILKLAARINGLAPGFDWLAFWKQHGLLTTMPPKPVPAEVAAAPFVPVTEDWSDLDLG